ncbi:MAG TPA: SDR family oxidoreductase [Kofleriaceae bacterium]|nr:SDR family oxidoreductase [Kofleriaceae bacterium]
MQRLIGNLALVTGGSSGIGLACARVLAAEGAGVLSCARRFARKPVTVPGAGEIVETHLDVTDEAQVRAVFAVLPYVDVLVCSHGTGTFAPIANANVADVRAMLDVHITGSFLCAREALRLMHAKHSGHIVLVSSHAAHHGFTECGGYTAAKAGQLGLGRVLAAEARPHNIRVTTLMPGATDTPIWDDRPGFDRSKMMQPGDVAQLLLALVTNPAISVDEVTVTPPAGVL